jgi:hypothetical protein
MNYAGTKIPAEFFCVTFVSDVEYVKRLGVKLGSTDRSQRKNQEAELAIFDYASRVATRPPGDRRAHPDRPASAMEQTRGRPVLAVNGGCRFSSKADLGKEWGFADGWLQA